MTRPSNVAKSKSKPKPAPVQASPSAEPMIAMTPRPKLFIALLVIFLVWIGFLVTLYFTTVYHKTDVHIEPAKAQAQP
jgi:hypothetical protein